jgi:TonB family protein
LNLPCRIALVINMHRSLRLWPCLLLCLLACAPGGSACAFAKDSTSRRATERSFPAREHDTFRPAIQKARFNDIPHALAPDRCENTHPPEALATPSPLLPGTAPDERLVVSFVVGTDGRVHSALVLRGGDSRDDRLVLEVVRRWRYRPATCNGVPTESEAKVEFSRP